MPNYLARFDRGPVERFECVNDAAARDYVKELLYDEGAEEGDGGAVYRVDEGGRVDEEYIGEVRLGDDDDDAADELDRPYGPGYPGPCPDGMDYTRWLAFNNID